jgi:phage baseplate assembly protein W
MASVLVAIFLGGSRRGIHMRDLEALRSHRERRDRELTEESRVPVALPSIDDLIALSQDVKRLMDTDVERGRKMLRRYLGDGTINCGVDAESPFASCELGAHICPRRSLDRSATDVTAASEPLGWASKCGPSRQDATGRERGRYAGCSRSLVTCRLLSFSRDHHDPRCRPLDHHAELDGTGSIEREGVMANDRAFLGKGLRFPVSVNLNGGVSTSALEENVRQSIFIILATAPGERLRRPQFGCRIHDLMFAPNNELTAAQAEVFCEEAICKLEPRVREVSCRASANPDESNRLDVHIEYVLAGHDNKRNLVFPFYLRSEHVEADDPTDQMGSGPT